MLCRLDVPIRAILILPLLAACGQPTTPTSPTQVQLAAKGADRPFTGMCTVTVAPRVHDDEGGCNGGEHDDHEGGGPPIGRHYDLTGSCQLAHLGRTDVAGRLNITGPFAAGHEGDDGHGSLAVRGRLLFTAANGDQLAGRYVPVAATFFSDGDGGTLQFTATERIGEACSGHEDGGNPPAHDGGHEEPTSTGRFVAATGIAGLTGVIRIRASTGQGSGTIHVADGRLSY